MLLKRYRVVAGLTQEELAERSGVSARTISDLERGIARRWRHDTISLVAGVLQLSAPEREAIEVAARRRSSSPAPARSAAAPSSALPTPPHHLPPHLTLLVGRERDEAAASHLLRQPEVRLLTLTGPAGVGKTRLAIQVAAGLVSTFADGVRFVPLATVREPELVLPAIALALGLRETGRSPAADMVVAFLHDRQLLLVLDNFEQVATAAPEVAEAVAACPRVTALVTSRAALRVRGEHELAVPSLALPNAEHPTAWGELGQFAAVALFVQRARAVKPTFKLTPSNAPLIATICRQLDGLPLAIELAATRIKLLPPPVLLAHLERSLSVLRQGPLDLPERQRTMERAIAWSYDLLSPDEQALFRRLSVFVGGWTLEAAAAIGSADGRRTADALEGLSFLVDKSLVVLEERENEEPRFRLLETIREFARGRLAESGEDQVVQERHAAYALALAEVAEPHLIGPQQGVWMARLAREHGNLQAALRWARAQREVELGLRLAGALRRFWSTRGYFGEGRVCIEELLALAGPTADSGVTARTRAKALLAVAVLLRSQGEPQSVYSYLEESLALRRQLADQAGIAEVLVFFGSELSFRGEAARATELLEEGLALYGELGDKRGVAEALDHLALLARNQGDYARATAMYERALAFRRGVGDLRGIGSSLFNLARMASSVQQDYPRAVALYEEALAISRGFGEQQAIATVVTNLADIAAKMGDLARAQALFEESLAVFRELGLITGVSTVLVNLGYIACAQGDTRHATALLKESLRLAWKTRMARKIAESLEALAEVAWAERRAEGAAQLYGTAAALRAAADAPILPADSAAYDRSVAAVRTALGGEAFTVIWEVGRGAPLEHVIADLEQN
jgi:predicted ATPase/transcriptional regulator with XRE-family HTH domain/Tfp pilus assembly protein PilF